MRRNPISIFSFPFWQRECAAQPARPAQALTIGKASDITHYTFINENFLRENHCTKKTKSLRNALMCPITVSGIVSSLEYLTYYA